MGAVNWGCPVWPLSQRIPTPFACEGRPSLVWLSKGLANVLVRSDCTAFFHLMLYQKFRVNWTKEYLSNPWKQRSNEAHHLPIFDV